MTKSRSTAWFATALTALTACGSEGPATAPPIEPGTCDLDCGTPIAAEQQREGDAEAGYHALVHEAYVGCGVPYSLYAQFFGAAPESQRLEGREGKNAEMPYNFNVATTPGGVEAVIPNCLSCHATMLDGEVVIGLGETAADYTTDQSGQLAAASALISDADEKAEMDKFAGRMKAIGEAATTDTVGVNPAENITAVLIAHRDRDTLEWSDEPLLPLPPNIVVPVDVPPWWRMKKKNAMFYMGVGRGDHARIMMTASTLCIDSVEQAEAIDAYFGDVRAYVASLEAPAYPHAVDQALADQGAGVFEANCSRCHGSYGADESYPNLLIKLEEVGTDDTLAVGTSWYAGDFVQWYEESFYGEVSDIASSDGYMAPPLDGIWATAPFLHNGSVPTLAALLESPTRPTYWTRTGQFDEDAVGTTYTESAVGHDGEPDANKRKLIYDTTRLGYSNRGHYYGDHLGAEERNALLEYLKTL